jgi:arsenite oxidase small subunit
MEAESKTKTRRLSRAELLVAGAAAAAGMASTAEAAPAVGGYPRLRVIELSELRVNRPVKFDYPLEGQPNVLLDMGGFVPHGVGPKKSIVAYSVLCQHMGCPVEYRPNAREFYCPCHQSRYDPERLGSIIQGIAPRPLPRVLLDVKGGAVWAVGVDGLIYGYRSNLTPGKRVGGKS